MAVPKLRFKAEDGSEFPEWEEMKLKDYCVYCKERNRSKVYIGTENMKKDFSGIEVDENRELAEGVEFSVGDILMSNIRPYLKKVWLADKSGVCSSDVLVFRPQRIYSNFLYYIIASEKFIEYVMSAAKGSNMPRGDKKHIMEMQLYSPSLPEQQKIADFLSTIDSIISFQKEELAAWEQRKKGVMQKLFSQEVRFKADDGSEFPDWEEKRLKDICCKIGSGKTPKGGQEIYQDCGVMLIRSQNVRNGFLDLTDVAYISNEVNQTMLGSTLKFNDLLLNITGASIGRCCKYNTTQQGNVNQHVCVLRIENQEDTLPDFALSYLLSDLIQNHIDLEQSGGSREGLNFQQVGNLNIKLPSLPEQKKIADCLSSIDEVNKKEKEELEKWQELKNGLLQQMFV